MILNINNEIDKKISTYFSKETIDNIKPEIIGNFGMNLTFEPDTDISFKMYYEQNYSKELYKKYNENIPIIKFLSEKDMIDVFEIVHDKNNQDCKRFNVKLRSCSNSNIMDLFNWLEKNISFTNKYKDEILNFAKIGNTSDSEYNYASLFFIGFVRDIQNNIKSFKCYFLNEIENNEYYFNFIKNCEIKEFKELLPIVNKILPKNGKNLWMEGIDYNEKNSEKHKIYINYSPEIFDKMIEVIPSAKFIEDKLKLIKDWQNIHSEFFCDGFAIGKNSSNNLTLNIYFRFKHQ